jgi:hypothetical protein
MMVSYRTRGAMVRPPTQPLRSDIAPEELGDFDFVVDHWATWGRAAPTPGSRSAGAYLDALLHSPPLAARVADGIRHNHAASAHPGRYSHCHREWVDQVLSYELGFFGVLPTHTLDAIAVGVRLEACQALHDGREEALTEEEALMTRYIRQYVHGEVTDESWDAMEALLGTRGLIELTAFTGYLLMTLRNLQAIVKLASPSKEEIGDLLRRIRDGSVTIPTPEHAGHVTQPRNRWNER